MRSLREGACMHHWCLQHFCWIFSCRSRAVSFRKRNQHQAIWRGIFNKQPVHCVLCRICSVALFSHFGPGSLQPHSTCFQSNTQSPLRPADNHVLNRAVGHWPQFVESQRRRKFEACPG